MWNSDNIRKNFRQNIRNNINEQQSKHIKSFVFAALSIFERTMATFTLFPLFSFRRLFFVSSFCFISRKWRRRDFFFLSSFGWAFSLSQINLYICLYLQSSETINNVLIKFSFLMVDISYKYTLLCMFSSDFLRLFIQNKYCFFLCFVVNSVRSSHYHISFK